MSKLSKKQSSAAMKPALPVKFDPAECPFRRFKDNELGSETWGLSTAGLRALNMLHPVVHSKGGGGAKLTTSSFTNSLWRDEQVQPLPRSVRNYLDGWVRAEELAAERWECTVVVSEENKSERMSIIDYQLSHTQVLLRSVFCRQVLSACFILERVEHLVVEHQWEGFNCSFGPEGWRAKYHIYSPGIKPGGGVQHKPTLSKNGCYLVRLFYLGTWRCIWVSDEVPVDATGAPLLPFSPLSTPSPSNNKIKGLPAMVTSSYVHLWPLLICKALLKLAAPEMTVNEEFNNDEDTGVQDEVLEDFDIMHCLTGGLSIKLELKDYDDIWNLLCKDVRIFTWDGDDDQTSGAMKSKSVKKPNARDKDKESGKREALVVIEMVDTKDVPSFTVPGITPAHAMPLYVSMVRDVPIKKPLPEPEVPQWKLVRWVDWAKKKGLYEAYECPRTKFLKVTGLTKMSYAPHLLDVQSNESLTQVFKEGPMEDKKGAAKKQVKDTEMRPSINQQIKEDLREWALFDSIHPFIRIINVVYCPSTYEFRSATSINQGVMKSPVFLNIQAPVSEPLYFQIDGPEENVLRISLNILHPKILMNTGAPLINYVEKAYLFLECFEWFVDCELPIAKAFIRTRCYDSVEVTFLPGRHYCRLWVHSPTHWHVSFLSESSLVLGTRDVVLVSSTLECDWSTRFLSTLGNSFSNWVRSSNTSTLMFVDKDKEFYSSYQPDLTWDSEKIGYIQKYLHWMFRQALQAHLIKRLTSTEFRTVCVLLRRLFLDPEFGFPPKPPLRQNLREILAKEPCECVLPEPEVVEEEEQQDEEQAKNEGEKEVEIVSHSMMGKLLAEPEEDKSHICDLATDELPCGILKEERLKYVKKNEAATLIQANWRGYFARKSLNMHASLSTEVLKILSEHVFGNFESLSTLMNEFFVLFPGTRYAYSVSSGLSGMRGLQQYVGSTLVTPLCKWIPYFQGVFNCHCPVKAHFAIHSSLEHTSVQIYDNDSGEQLPQAYSAHITFHLEPNILGYTVMGHGSLNFPLDILHEIEIPWSFTILGSINNVFHPCDHAEKDVCTPLPLPQAMKFHLDEMFVPNRRNILGSIQVSVVTVEPISFRAETTLPTLDIEAVLRSTDADGKEEELARCSGKGEIFWPYLYLKPHSLKNDGISTGTLTIPSVTTIPSSRTLSKGKSVKGAKIQSRSLTKLQHVPKPQEPKTYTIEVIAPDGWALPLNQWTRIDEVRNSTPLVMPPPSTVEKDLKPQKTTAVAKTGSAKSDKKKEEEKQKEKEAPPAQFFVFKPRSGDASVVLECATTDGGGALVKRDDTRDLLFANTVRNWNLKDPGRNNRGAEIRQQFREEYLVQAAVKSETVSVSFEGELIEFEDDVTVPKPRELANTPATDLSEMAVEVEEESLYYTLPDAIRDKFVPLHFIPECTKDMVEEKGVLFTDEMIEAAKTERAARFEAALQRMRDLQYHNEVVVLEGQKTRVFRLNSLEVDDVWSDSIVMSFEDLDAAVREEQAKQQSLLLKKKMEQQLAKEAEKIQNKASKVNKGKT